MKSSPSAMKKSKSQFPSPPLSYTYMPRLSHSLATSLITPSILSFSLVNPSSFADHIVMRSGTILQLMLGVAVAKHRL